MAVPEAVCFALIKAAGFGSWQEVQELRVIHLQDLCVIGVCLVKCLEAELHFLLQFGFLGCRHGFLMYFLIGLLLFLYLLLDVLFCVVDDLQHIF